MVVLTNNKGHKNPNIPKGRRQRIMEKISNTNITTQRNRYNKARQKWGNLADKTVMQELNTNMGSE